MRRRCGPRGPAVLGALAGLLVVAVPLAAHVRLKHPTNGNLLRWSNPSAVKLVVNDAGSDDVADESELPAIQLAIRAWNDLEGTTATLVEDTSAASRARTDWESSSVHLVLFDENDDSGFFPPMTGIVALTPVWFGSNGVISDADVLFNGDGFQFTTSAAPGLFDVQDVATHELGHFLGLDHTGFAGATMYPYVDPAVILHRSLSRDEVGGLRDAYPDGSFGSIRGRVLRLADSSPVAGAHVVARDAEGRTAGAALANSSGTFTLRGLDPGTYSLAATPLDQPVSAANLGAGNTVETDFASTELAAGVVVATSQVTLGDVFVDADVPVALGRNTDELPLFAQRGNMLVFSLGGTGLANGSTLEASDPDLVVTPLAWLGTGVTFGVTIPAGEEPGHADLLVTDPGGDHSLLPGALEIVPADPTVSMAAPALASISGGTAVTISGTGFRAGARVVLGRELYVDGDVDGCTVVDPNTITLTTRPTPAGDFDVVVQDPSGVEGRAVDGFTFAALPDVQGVFPASGSAGGGTLVHLVGQDFEAGCTVRIDGALQTNVQVLSSTALSFTTAPGVAGGPYVLEVRTPENNAGTAAFTYVATPDPAITAVEPESGGTAGGTHVLVTGAGFTADTELVFGADPVTGLGGAPATDVVVVDPGTIDARTPPGAAGLTAVLVRVASTGQAAVLADGFRYKAPSGGGGGGCSVGEAPSGGPFEGLSALLPVLAAFALLLLVARPRAAARA